MFRFMIRDVLWLANGEYAVVLAGAVQLLQRQRDVGSDQLEPSSVGSSRKRGKRKGARVRRIGRSRPHQEYPC